MGTYIYIPAKVGQKVALSLSSSRTYRPMSTGKELESGATPSLVPKPQAWDLRRDEHGDLAAVKRADNALLAKLGYRNVFNRDLSVSLQYLSQTTRVPELNLRAVAP